MLEHNAQTINTTIKMKQQLELLNFGDGYLSPPCGFNISYPEKVIQSQKLPNKNTVVNQTRTHSSALHRQENIWMGQEKISRCCFFCQLSIWS